MSRDHRKLRLFELAGALVVLHGSNGRRARRSISRMVVAQLGARAGGVSDPSGDGPPDVGASTMVEVRTG